MRQVLGVILLFVAGFVQADELGSMLPFENPSPNTDDQFGHSVSVSGDRVLVSAYLDDTTDTDSGRAYLFDAVTGLNISPCVPPSVYPDCGFENPSPDGGDRFGYSASVSGDRVLVGAYLDDTTDTNSGRAYLFDAVTGLNISPCVPPAVMPNCGFENPLPNAGDQFGWSVSVSGDRVLVGAYRYDDVTATDSGRAYLFDAVTGNLVQTFDNPSPNASDQFGISVSVSGDRVLVGARDDDTTGSDSGRAYLFDAVTGNLVQTFANPSPDAGDQFGFSVSVAGDRVLVGAWKDDTTATDSGRAYLFDAVTGNLVQTFENPSLFGGDRFGRSVSVSGDQVLVGAYADATSFTDSGRAYQFNAVTGNLVQTFANPSPDAGDLFGISVSVSGDRVLVGARNDDTTAGDSGRAYMFYNQHPLGATLPVENPSPDAGDFFGGSVSVSGDRVLVGTDWDDTTAFHSGRAYLFDAVTNNLVQTFENPSPDADDQFGRSVSVSGDRILVGAWSDDTTASVSGRAYLFDAVTGNLVQTLENPSPDADDQFGRSVSVAGNRVLVGAYLDDTTATDSGRAYLFDAVTGNLVQTFENPSPDADDRFGQSVSVAGNRVLVGAYLDDTTATDSGRAYLFDAVTGSLMQTFENPSPDASDQFGISVSVAGDRILVGARDDDTTATDSGRAYLFDAVTGNVVQTFENPSPDADDHFGRPVSVAGDWVLVGAYLDDTTGTDSGRAYLFDAVTGSLMQTFENPSPNSFDQFGFSVSVSDDRALVGAWSDNTTASASGRAYLFFEGLTADIEVIEPPAGAPWFGGLHVHHRGQGGLPNDTVPVVVLGLDTNDGDSVDLDVTEIDPASLRLGPGRAPIDPASTPNLSYNHDSDGNPDALFEFRMSDTGFPYTPGTGSPCYAPAALDGALTTGPLFAGEDLSVITYCDGPCH